eukprot:2531195-Rhodomonas_salina.2
MVYRYRALVLSTIFWPLWAPLERLAPGARSTSFHILFVPRAGGLRFDFAAQDLACLVLRLRSWEGVSCVSAARLPRRAYMAATRCPYCRSILRAMSGADGAVCYLCPVLTWPMVLPESARTALADRRYKALSPYAPPTGCPVLT